MRLHLCLLFCLYVPKNADACTQSCIQTPAHFDIHTCTHMHAHMYTGTRTHKGMHPWMSMQKTHVHIGKHSCYYIALDECNPKLLIDFRHTTASPCPFACSPSVQHSTTIAAPLSWLVCVSTLLRLHVWFRYKLSLPCPAICMVTRYRAARMPCTWLHKVGSWR